MTWGYQTPVLLQSSSSRRFPGIGAGHDDIVRALGRIGEDAAMAQAEVDAIGSNMLQLSGRLQAC